MAHIPPIPIGPGSPFLLLGPKSLWLLPDAPRGSEINWLGMMGA